jgi:hypothetical protein
MSPVLFLGRTIFALTAWWVFAACGAATLPATRSLAAEGELTCNGAAALCDRRYDEVVYLTTHNAMSHAGAFWLAPNQNHNIARQLANGVRGLSLDLFDNPFYPSEPLLCHGVCFAGTALFSTALRSVRQFLEQNPHDVLTILYEGKVDDRMVAQTLTRVGLGPYLHTQTQGADWPTLREMILRGTRLVVFSQDTGGEPAWLHRMWTHTWDTPYAYRSIKDFDCGVGRGSPDNGIFQINHFLTAPIASEALAREANRHDVLMSRVLRCQEETGRLPTFLWVDWYATGDALRVVTDLNARLPVLAGSRETLKEILP